MDCVLKGRDVRIPTQDLRVRRDELPVEIRKQFVAAESTDHRQDSGDLRIREGRMKIIDA